MWWSRFCLQRPGRRSVVSSREGSSGYPHSPVVVRGREAAEQSPEQSDRGGAQAIAALGRRDQSLGDCNSFSTREDPASSASPGLARPGHGPAPGSPIRNHACGGSRSCRATWKLSSRSSRSHSGGHCSSTEGNSLDAGRKNHPIQPDFHSGVGTLQVASYKFFILGSGLWKVGIPERGV